MFCEAASFSSSRLLGTVWGSNTNHPGLDNEVFKSVVSVWPFQLFYFCTFVLLSLMTCQLCSVMGGARKNQLCPCHGRRP